MSLYPPHHLIKNQSLQDLINDNNIVNQFFSGNAGLQENFIFSDSGRYVRIQLSGTNQTLHMAEVQIIGCANISTSLLYNIGTPKNRLMSLDFIVFPVPSKEVFNFILPESFKGNGVLFVTDISGKIMLKKNINSLYRENLQFKLKNTSDGVYNVILKQKEFIWRKQIMLRR